MTDPFAAGAAVPALVDGGRWVPDPPLGPLPAEVRDDPSWFDGPCTRVAAIAPGRVTVQRARFAQVLAARHEGRGAGPVGDDAYANHLAVGAMLAGAPGPDGAQGPLLCQRRGAVIALPHHLDGTATGMLDWPDDAALPDIRAALAAELAEETGWPAAWWAGRCACLGVIRAPGSVAFHVAGAGALTVDAATAVAAFRASAEVSAMEAVDPADPPGPDAAVTPFARWFLSG